MARHPAGQLRAWAADPGWVRGSRPVRAALSGQAHSQGARLFATAGRSANQPHTADVGTKVAFGLGRTYVCLTSTGVNRQSQARQELAAVLRDYSPAPGNHHPRVQLLAAEAHGQLGALDYVLATTTRSRRRYQAAAASYGQALELSAARPDRQWKFYDVLAAVYQRLGDTTRAKQAARNADDAAKPPTSRRWTAPKPAP